jgi:prephenate dehydrogenase
MNRVTIVGVGLIGGSFGLALKAHGFPGRITGVGRPATLQAALECGAIDEAQEHLAPAVGHADLVFLATPILNILEALEPVRQAAPATALVTDAGSTKEQICDRAARLFDTGSRFIGGHPLAGSEQRGVAAAHAGLFAGARWALTPARHADLESPPGRSLREWIERIGAQPVVMDAAVHDEIVAWTSHLPQLAATALAATVLDNLESADDLHLSASGLRDTTRLAGSSYALWRDICLTNAGNIEEALGAFIQRLEHLRENLRTRELEAEFRSGQTLRDALLRLRP